MFLEVGAPQVESRIPYNPEEPTLFRAPHYDFLI